MLRDDSDTGGAAASKGAAGAGAKGASEDTLCGALRRVHCFGEALLRRMHGSDALSEMEETGLQLGLHEAALATAGASGASIGASERGAGGSTRGAGRSMLKCAATRGALKDAAPKPRGALDGDAAPPPPPPPPPPATTKLATRGATAHGR